MNGPKNTVIAISNHNAPVSLEKVLPGFSATRTEHFSPGNVRIQRNSHRVLSGTALCESSLVADPMINSCAVRGKVNNSRS